MISFVGWQIYLFFFPPILLFTWLGLYTLQVSGLFNVFNFFAVAAVGLSLFSAFLLNEAWSSKKRILKILVILFVVVTLPRPIFEVVSRVQAYATNHYDQMIPNEEVTGLVLIQKQTPANTVVQSELSNENDQKAPYVSFFSNRPTYLSGTGLLASNNRPVADR